MDIGSIFLLLGLLVMVALFISQPIMQQKATVVSAEEHEYSALLAERDRILNALQELDFDNTLGKIPEESYPEQRAMLLQKGASILRQLDEYQAGMNGDKDIDSRLEAAIEAHRADGGDQEIPVMDDDDLETMIANRRRSRTDKSGGFCPNCGNAIQQSDLFCPKCGASLK